MPSAFGVPLDQKIIVSTMNLNRFLNLVTNPMESALLDLVCLRGSTGGVLKRIDENRELLETLQRDAPDLLRAKPWIIGWIECNDSFFTQVANITKQTSALPDYPRPWPK